MCRIAGIIDRESNQIERDIFAMRDAMKHGGPDSEGVFTYKDASLALGHRRLSIIDITSSGNQPMRSEDGEIVLIFNGEIYNFLELKQELVNAGFHFFSQSDTEVILKSYQKWGTMCFGKFKGMFALAIFDQTKNEVILARDHAGIKPLYYYHDAECLYFASEIRAFNATVRRWEEDPTWKIYFLTYGFLPAHITTLKYVSALEKGSFKVFNTKTLKSQQTFYYREDFSERVNNVDEAHELIEYTMQSAVRRHLIADAPIGLFLSGGIDSSLLTILAGKYKSELHTLSLIFEDKQFSEQYYQDIIVELVGTNHQSFLLKKEQFVSAIPDIFTAMDQPSTDGINSYFISKFAKQAGLKAVLSGLGADELFGGYPSFKRNGIVKRLRMLPDFILNSAHLIPQNKYHKISFLGSGDDTAEYLFNRGYYIPLETAKLMDIDVKEVRSILSEYQIPTDVSRLSDGNRTSYLESNLYMEHQLLKDTDYMSMWHSIEVRVPFLDYDLVRAVHSISSQLKFGHEQTKSLLINTFPEILPSKIWNRKKKGFQLPFNTWMQESLDQFITTNQDQKIHKKFKNGQLTWSRYWAYILSRTF